MDAQAHQATSELHRRRPASYARWAIGVSIGLMLLFGLVTFSDFVRGVNALSAPTATAQADGIVVVTGGQARIEVAVQLLENGAAERLLISGVHDGTSAASLVARTQVDADLFGCCVDLDRAAMDTAGNAREAASWSREHGFDSLLVVTSAYHMPRTTLEIERLLPDVDLIAVPIDPATETQRADGGPVNTWPMRLLAREFVKLGLARVRHLVDDVS